MDILDQLNIEIKKIKKIFVGKTQHLNLVICAIISNGHILLEDVPGVGKTSLVKLMAKLFNLEINRVQFTNDLLPSDIIGTNIFDKETTSFIFHKGPVFTQILLADELNRASSRTQSALLQAMQEREISLDGQTNKLDEFFLVMGTQNPREQIGTNFLPESQLDRFFFKLSLGFASKEYELELLKGEDRKILIEQYYSKLNTEHLMEIKKLIQDIAVSDSIYEYAYALLDGSRESSKVLSLSSRCGRDLIQASKSYVWLMGREYVTPDDVKLMFPVVAGHRLVAPHHSNVSLEKELSCELLSKVAIPR